MKALLVLTFLLLGWLIGWSNNDKVSFAFMNWQLPELPVYILYCLFLVTGVFVGLVLGRLSSRR